MGKSWSCRGAVQQTRDQYTVRCKFPENPSVRGRLRKCQGKMTGILNKTAREREVLKLVTLPAQVAQINSRP